MQFLAKIGAMSLLNVGAAAPTPVKLPPVMTTAAATIQNSETKTIIRERFIGRLLEICVERKLLNTPVSTTQTPKKTGPILSRFEQALKLKAQDNAVPWHCREESWQGFHR